MRSKEFDVNSGDLMKASVHLINWGRGGGGVQQTKIINGKDISLALSYYN